MVIQQTTSKITLRSYTYHRSYHKRVHQLVEWDKTIFIYQFLPFPMLHFVLLTFICLLHKSLWRGLFSSKYHISSVEMTGTMRGLMTSSDLSLRVASPDLFVRFSRLSSVSLMSLYLILLFTHLLLMSEWNIEVIV